MRLQFNPRGKVVLVSKRGVILLGIILVCIAASGFRTELSAQAESGHLVYATKDTPDTLDVTKSSLPIVHAMAWNYLDPLVRRKKGETGYYPGLAQRWTVSPDLKTYTFQLRRDVRFHDGTPLTADAVKAGIERLLDTPAAPLPGRSEARTFRWPLLRCETADEHTVRVLFAEPCGSFLRAASTVSVPILSPHAKGGLEAVGTGPFILEEYVEGDHATFVRNDAYTWGPGWTHGGPAYIERLTYRFIPEEIVRIAMLRGNEADLIDGVSANQIYRVLRDKRLGVGISEFRGAPWTLFFNCGRFPTNDRVVRQAVSYAIDRESMVERLFKGTTGPAFSPLERGTSGYDRDVESLSTHDPGRAAAILDRAGWVKGPDGVREKKGRRLVVVALVPESQREAAQAVASQIEKIGVELRVNIARREAPHPAEGEQNLLLTCRYGTDPLFLHEWVSSCRNGKEYPPYYVNPRLSDLLVEAEAAVDPSGRAATYRTVQEVLLIEAACVPLYEKSMVLGFREEVGGITYSPAGYPLFYEVSFME